MPVRRVCQLLLACTLFCHVETFAQAIKLVKAGADTILSKTTPLIAFNGGFANYNYTYRSRLDTPFAERNLSQHVGTGYLGFTVANKFPLRFTYLVRQGNSAYFRNIYDARVEFDAASFKQFAISRVRQQITDNLENFRDSVSEKLYYRNLEEAKKLKHWFEDPFTAQALYEMNEVARMPHITYDRNLPDSIAKERSDSLQTLAKTFLDHYALRKQQHELFVKSADSLKKQLEASKQKISALREFITGNYRGWKSLQQWKAELAAFSGNTLQLPKRYEWMLGIRNMSVGRTQLNYSELTVKNLGLNGFNFEYNSWYYFAVTAGLIDYRFRDFSFASFKRTAQYLYMARLGLGELERNYFIVSAFKGQKQLYSYNNAGKGARSIGVTGLSLEGKYQFAKSSYIIAEAAQAFAPELTQDPPANNRFWNLSDLSNKALSLKLYSFIARTGSRIEGLYKYTGPGYQSFSSFQTNAAFTSWHIKIDQGFFKRSLKLTASIRSNEFSNPYIVQNYKSSSIFKTLIVTYRRRKLPSVSIGYIPASQFMKLDNRLLESRFQTLSLNMNHVYRFGTSQAATAIAFSRFYNTQADSSYAYFNAVNIVAGQSFFFKSFNATLSLIQTRNSDYRLNVLDGNIQVPVGRASVGAGAKINTLNKLDLKVGYYGNVQLKLRKEDIFFLSFEKSYLNGQKNNLVDNDCINIGLSKYFR
jgi:hypothetical protein